MNAERDRALFELEQRLARVGGKISAEEARSLIAEDFVEFGASGRVWSKAEIVAALPYRIGSSLRSSVWRRGGERWQIVFHQGTGVA